MRYVAAEDHFEVSGVKLPRFPILLDGSGCVVPEGIHFLSELAVMRGQAIGTLKDVASILCAWMNYVESMSSHWRTPEAAMFVRWCKSDEQVAHLSVARRRRRAAVVYAFYEFADRHGDSLAMEKFVVGLTSPIPVDRLLQGVPVRRTLRLRFGRAPARVHGFRPTPNEDEVDRIANILLGDGGSIERVRNWLIVQAARATGLRTEGLAGLTVAHIDAALARAGILKADETALDQARDRSGRSRIRSRLGDLREAGALHVVASGIREKGRSRSVAFPIELVLQLLDFVWNERAGQIAKGRAGVTEARSKGRLWISSKTGAGLQKSSIADIINAGFKAAEIAGSAHRLRAAFCVSMFRRLIREAREAGGTRHDAYALLERVAQYMGHEHPETLRPYLHTAQLEDLALHRH